MYCLDDTVFNVLPSYNQTQSDNPKKFKLILQEFLYKNSFYSLDEYFELKKIKFIYVRFKSVYENLVYKIDIYLCLFYSLTTYLVFESVF